MIARYWRGRVRARDAASYVDYVRRTGIAGQRGTPGNVGSMMLVRGEGDETEVAVLSLWESFEAIRRFAGEDPEVAVFYPEDDQYLTGRDLFAQHFDVPAFAVAGATSDPGAAQAAIPHASYSDGRIQSLRFSTDGGAATVGVITPGTYEFTPTAEARVTLLSGTLEVRQADASRQYAAGETYAVPSGVACTVRASVPVAYLCRFVSP